VLLAATLFNSGVDFKILVVLPTQGQILDETMDHYDKARRVGTPLVVVSLDILALAKS
jgi:hypothetical protein